MFRVIAVLLVVAFAFDGRAATPALKSAKVTQVQNEVTLQSGAPLAESRKAVVGDMVQGSRTLATGRKSRAELLFNDNTIARLGANSVFSFKPGSREIDLQSGFLLLHTPKGKGGAKITTPSASASVLGTTIMLSALPGGGMKLVVLEGMASVTYNGITQTIGAGQLVFLTKENGMSPPINVDLGKLVGSSGLINGMPGTIGSENLINEAIQNQSTLIADGQLENSGFVIGGDQNGLRTVDQAVLDAEESADADQPSNDVPPEGSPPPNDNPPPGDPAVFNVNPDTVLNYADPAQGGLPTLTNSGDEPLIGALVPPDGIEGSEGSHVYFTAEQFSITGGPPIEQNGAEVSSLNFISTASGADALVFENFTDGNGGDGEGAADLNFYSLGGAIRVSDTFLAPDNHLGFFALDFGESTGDLLIENSTIGNGPSVGNELVGGGLAEIFAAAVNGDVVIDNSTVQTYVPETGEVDFNVGINVASTNGNIEIRNQSQLLAHSESVSVPVTVIGSGPGSMVLIDQSVISSALGAQAGPVNVFANRIDLTSAQISAVSESGATAPVNLIADVINMTDSVIRGSTILLGNPANPGAAQINFEGVNQFYTDTGDPESVSFQGNIGGSGSYEILPNNPPLLQ
jgi:hypothetical protein